MKKFLLLCALTIGLMQTNADAQGYKNAIGIRFGSPWAISYKTFITNQNALEFTGFWRDRKGWNYMGVGAQWLHHMPIRGAQGLNWYVGLGGKLAFITWDDDFLFDDDDSKTMVGINGALGLDYKFKDAPINLSLDWTPTFWVSGYGDGFSGDNINLAVRFTF